MTDQILQVKNLCKSFGKVPAVVSLSFSINKGECFALLGPNGAGKTTTCEILEGLLEQDSGEVWILGRKQPDFRREVMPKLGVQLQETVLYPKYTVTETLELFASFFPSPMAVDTLIAKVGLTNEAHKRLEKLSGGQRQRVNVACALINNPALIFLDEPTTGLDPLARRNLWEAIAEIKKDGRSLLLTTHYLEEAQRLADRLAIIDKGSIIAEGTPKYLIQKYCGEQMLWFRFEEPATASQAQEKLRLLVAGLAWLNEATPVDDGFQVIATSGVEAMQTLLREVERLGLKLHAIELRDSTLDDVYLKLTGRNRTNDQ